MACHHRRPRFLTSLLLFKKRGYGMKSVAAPNEANNNNGTTRFEETIEDDSPSPSTSTGCSPLVRRRKKFAQAAAPHSPRKARGQFRKILDSFSFAKFQRSSYVPSIENVPTSDSTRSTEEQDNGEVVTLLLDVSLSNGENLPVKDTSGSSDPYVKFRYKNELVYKSSTIFKNLNPQWDEDFQMIVDDVNNPVEIEVFDYDRFCTDDFMGSATIDLTQLKWRTPTYIVAHLRDEDQQEAGTLSICLTINPMTQQEVEAFSQKKINNSNDNKKHQEWSKIVNIVLVEAELEESLDIFCKFKLGSEKYKSKVCTASKTPKWVEQWDMHVFDIDDQILQMTCVTRSTNMIIGKLSIPLSDLNINETLQKWYNLESPNSIKAKILLLITVSGSRGEEEITNGDYNSNDMRNNYIEKYDIFNSFSDSLDNVGVLTVKVFCAEDLQAKDFGGKSDPFAVLELVNTRVQTQTVYKTLNPHWNKIYTFSVKDIHTCLEVKVYDEDPNNRFEFLGRVSIPLIDIKNCEKRWYALKDWKLRKESKGYILLELDIIWNPLRAAIRTFKPKEIKYVSPEQKFKASLFRATVVDLKNVALSIINFKDSIEYLLSWKSKPKSAISLLIYIMYVYFFQLYFLPLSILIFLFYKLFARKIQDDRETVKSQKSFEDDDKTSSLRDTLITVQETLVDVQNYLVFIVQLIERIENFFNFTHLWLSFLAMFVITIALFILYFIPLRWILLVWGINKYSKKLRNPNFVDNNEILDFLSRVPCKNDLVEQTNNHVYRPT